MSKEFWVAEVLLTIYVKGRHNLPEVFNLFVICANLQKITQLILFQADFDG